VKKFTIFQNLSVQWQRIVSFFIKNKRRIIISFSVTLTIGLVIIGLLKTKDTLISQNKSRHDAIFSENFSPTPKGPLFSLASSSANSILGSTDESTYEESVSDIPYVPLAPLPTMTPYPTFPPYVAPTSAPAQTTNNTGNPNCTTAANIPNAWYSDVYPASPQTTMVGSAVTFVIDIRDCYKNDAPVSDTLKISLTSGENAVQINGNNLPYTVVTQNGKATFSMTSGSAGTFGFVIEDTTRSFTVTDTNNHNPSVIFTSNSSGNPNCTTATNIPNFWYSDVLPASPITTLVGSSAGFSVDIRDCSKNSVSNDTLTISLSSGESSVQINGNSLPYTTTVQNGKATFSVTSSNAGTYGFIVKDTTNNFTVTDSNNHNPSVIFTASSTTPTPQPTSAQTPTDTPTSTPSNPTATQTPSPTSGTTPPTDVIPT
jgi:hypothetical protein